MKPVVRVVEVITVIASAIFVIALFANQPADSTTSTDPDDPTIESADPLVVGQEVYGRRCAGCHGGDGQGSVGPQLGGGASIAAFPDPADMATVVREGRSGMPAFGNLSAEEIDAVVLYSRELPG